jgi:UDP-N-acetylglucosamine:LPS N-acetylglucosamine transferase
MEKLIMLKRVLILTSDLGFGHRSAANAVNAALIAQYGNALRVDIINPMEHPKVPRFFKDSPEAYDLMVKKMPDLYKMTYKAVDTPISSAVLENTNTVMLIEAIWNIVKEHEPDVIVITRENYLSSLWALFAFTRKHIPVVTIVTDLGTVHRMWFNNVSDVTCVPNQRVYEIGLGEDIPPHALKITGIPVHPRLLEETRNIETVRQELGWRTDLTTFLVVGGSRVRHTIEAVRVLNHANHAIQLIVVAGGDDPTYEQLQQMEWHIPTHIYHFAKNMPTLLYASDVLVCKAGGLMVTEGLASGLPILLIDAIEGQETGNVEFVEDNGAGIMAKSAIEILETVHHWLLDGSTQLQLTANRAQQIGFPRAAFDIAEMVYSYANGDLKTESVRDETEERHYKPLRDFLKRFNLEFD